MKVALTFFPNQQKTNRKTGKIPIYMRLYHLNKKAEARLNVEISEKDLLKWNLHVMRVDDKNSKVNGILNAIGQVKHFLSCKLQKLIKFTIHTFSFQ